MDDGDALLLLIGIALMVIGLLIVWQKWLP
jgi:LPXTG-motif cell wall-anchored protein